MPIEKNQQETICQIQITCILNLIINDIKNKMAIEAIFSHQTEEIKRTFTVDQAWRK